MLPAEDKVLLPRVVTGNGGGGTTAGEVKPTPLGRVSMEALEGAVTAARMGKADDESL